ncbi:MAG: hypothetical protein ABEL51_03280, partial [Salinibacter sp.]
YCSRALDGDTDYPRYYTLEDRTAVRVVESHPAWKNQAKQLIARAKKWSEDDATASTPKKKETSAPSTSSKVSSETSSAGGPGVGLSWADRLGIFWDVLLFILFTFGAGYVLVRGLGWYLDARREEAGTPPHMDGKEEESGEASEESETSTTESTTADQAEQTNRDEGDPEIQTPIAAEGLRTATSMSEEQGEEQQGEESGDVRSSVEDEPTESKGTSDTEEDTLEESSATSSETQDDHQGDSEPSISERDRRILDRCGTAFTDWCREEDDLRPVGGRFEWFLENRLSSSVSVSHWATHNEDKYARAAPSDATHWVVEVEKVTVLLPRPRTEGFASTSGYNNTEPPDQVTDVVPALVTVEENDLSLHETGHLQ